MKRILPKVSLLLMVIFILLSATPLSALADGGAQEFTQTMDGYQVTLLIEKPLSTGENQIHIQVLDVEGQPVSNALVDVGVVAAGTENAQVESTHPQNVSGPQASPTPQENTEGTEGMQGMNEHQSAPAPQEGLQGTEGMPGMSAHQSSPANPADTQGMPGMDEPQAAPIHQDPPQDAQQVNHQEMDMVAMTAGDAAGEYVGNVNLSEAGKWELRVHLTVEGRLVEFSFPIQAASPKTGRTILLAFLALNTLIVGTAFTIKHKPAAA